MEARVEAVGVQGEGPQAQTEPSCPLALQAITVPTMAATATFLARTTALFLPGTTAPPRLA